MTPEQEAAVDNLAESQSSVSTADLATAGERDTQPAVATPTADSAPPAATGPTADARSTETSATDVPADDVGVQPRQPEQHPTTGDRSAEQREVERTPVMSGDAAEQYRARWQETQADFVDDPRSAVATADALVAEVMKRVAEEFANERNGLERQWNEGGEASTEDLRVAFQRYRSFFSRLLSL
jgi:hypothetical protein